MTHRLFTACLGTETNSFSPIPTGLSVFEAAMLVRGGQHGGQPSLFAVPLVRWRERAQALGWTVIESLAAFATPAGNTTRALFEALRDEILADLQAALPVSAVMLNLHGAMIAEGYLDAEGDLLQRVRALVGPDVPVLAELDLHCHLTQLKVASADALVIYKEYPHVDVAERAAELFELLQGLLAGQVRPVMALVDIALLGIFPTTAEPMAGIVARMKAMEREPGVLSVSLAHGFPWGDTPEVGARALVVTDDDQPLAERLAGELGGAVWALRERLSPPFMSIDEAIDRVLSHAPDGRPFVLADTADNPGIGAAGDSTFLLHRLIERGVGGVALSPLWDPTATALAFDAGVGARLAMRLGGKLGPASGAPLDVSVQVMSLTPAGQQPFGGTLAPLGRMAWLRIGAVADDTKALDVVVNDHRIQTFHPDCFSVAGLNPTRPRALVVKSTQHFHAGFAPIAREIIYVSAPGTGAMDMQALDYRQVRRALWPRVLDPARFGPRALAVHRGLQQDAMPLRDIGFA